MEIIDNVNQLFGDNLKQRVTKTSRLKIAASCFSMFAFEALRDQLEAIDSLEFIFTSPTFVPGQATDAVKRERREFVIPKSERERSFYGTEFEIQLKNKLTQTDSNNRLRRRDHIYRDFWGTNFIAYRCKCQ